MGTGTPRDRNLKGKFSTSMSGASHERAMVPASVQILGISMEFCLNDGRKHRNTRDLPSACGATRHKIAGIARAFCPIMLCKLKTYSGRRANAKLLECTRPRAILKGKSIKLLLRVLRIGLAVVLVAILAVLYVLSQGGDLRRQTQIASDLRNLKDIDTAWNRDVAAARGDPFAPEQLPLQLDSRLDSLLTDMKAETLVFNNPSLINGVENLLSAFLQKRKLTAQFEQSSSKLRGTVRQLLDTIAQARQALASLLEGDAKLRARLAPVDGQLVALSSDVFRLYLQGDGTARTALQSSDWLQPQYAESFPEPLRGKASAIGTGISALLQQEPVLSELARQIGLLPTAPRISS